MFKEHKEFTVPAKDEHCHLAVFDTVVDLSKSIPLCKEKNIAVQAGGNFGTWPLELSKHFKTVYTFEPDPLNFSCLCRNIGDVQNIIKIQAGLADAHACIDMVREEANAGAHHVDLKAHGVLPLLRLDDFALPACDLLVLDIEGMELPALKGAHRTIESFLPVIHLESKQHGRRYGYERGDLFDWLLGFGYQIRDRVNRDIILTV